MVVTGDTKVVNRGDADGIFVNTSGIGVMRAGVETSGKRACAGDRVIVSGTIGDHGIAVLSKREGLEMESSALSDAAPLNGMLEGVLALGESVKFLRDPTRGGLASALNEFARSTGLGVELEEDQIPVRPEVRGVCELLGMDPMYVANEGKCVAVVASDVAEAALKRLHEHPLGQGARDIGQVVAKPPGRVLMKTEIGGTRIVDTLVGEQLPRIC